MAKKRGMKNIPLFYFTIGALIFFNLVACTKKEPVQLDPSTMSIEQKLERGRSIYLASCASCHHVNPKKDGSIGPSVFGSSVELLKARLVDGNYPAGYKPKRESMSMIKMPHLEKEIPFLFEYLNNEPKP
jgi:mono/diheme cytochrome c family protein